MPIEAYSFSQRPGAQQLEILMTKYTYLFRHVPAIDQVCTVFPYLCDQLVGTKHLEH